ncbi:MAG: hypothetical protein AB1714_01020 [Acidobacteriota bacterium]
MSELTWSAMSGLGPTTSLAVAAGGSRAPSGLSVSPSMFVPTTPAQASPSSRRKPAAPAAAAEAPAKGTEEDYALAWDGTRLTLDDTPGDASRVWEGDPNIIYAPADAELGLPDFMWEKSPEDGTYEWPDEAPPEGGWNQWTEDAPPPGGDPEQQAPTPFTPPPGSEVVYYVYGHDGKLLAEYDTNGFCDRDYIYAGNRLVAEYRPKESKFYFYAQDQINSTRVVTDSSGTRTYAATYDPFGGIQLETGDTAAPTLKFSGRERDSSTGFDYFGAAISPTCNTGGSARIRRSIAIAGSTPRSSGTHTRTADLVIPWEVHDRPLGG